MRIHALAMAALLAAPAARAATLEVTVQGVRSAAGHVLVAVCDPATFTHATCRYTGSAPAAPGAVTVRVEGVPPGTYAVQAFHDENDNRKIDRTFLGMPEEGIGFSNDAKMNFGPPSFADAAISLGPQGGRISFTLRYF